MISNAPLRLQPQEAPAAEATGERKKKKKKQQAAE